MESAVIPFDQLGLPLTDMVDFIMDIGANWSNLNDDDKDVRLMGALGFIALIVSCIVNLVMVIFHYRKFKRLYDTLMSKSTTLKVAFLLWMPVACSNIEVVLLYIAFAKIYSGSFEINLGIRTFHRGNELNERTFLPRAVMNEMEVASIQVKKFALFSQLTENLPELIFQGRACLLMMAADPPRIPGNWQLLSLGSTFLMLFGKMIVNLLLFAVDVGVSKKLMKLFLEEGIPTGEQNTDGTQIMKDVDRWRLPAIKFENVRIKTYCLCAFSGLVTLCSVAFYGELLLYAEFAREDLLEVIILMLFAAGLVSLVTFFLTTRLVAQELDLCWQVNLDVYKATFVLLCSSFASGMLGCIHEDLAVAANRHLVGLISVARSCLFMASLATTKIYPMEMREVIGKPSVAWNIHEWSDRLGEDASLSSVALHRLVLLAANLFTALLHLNLCLWACCNSQRTVNGDYYKMDDVETADRKTWGTSAEKLSEAHDTLEKVQEERIRTLLGKDVSKNEEFDDLVTSTLIILDEGNDMYMQLIAFNTKRQELDASLKRAMESAGSSSLNELLGSGSPKFGLDVQDYEQELSERRTAEESLEESITSTIGTQAIREVIDKLSSAKIDFAAAEAERERRSKAEHQVTAGIGETVGSSALKDLIQSLAGDRINFESVEAELKERERREEDLAEAVDNSVGANALKEVMEKLSAAKIDFAAAQSEVGKRSQAEKKLTDGMGEVVGSNPLKDLIQSVTGDRIDLESAEAELKKRERAEADLAEAVGGSVGASALSDVIDQLSVAKIDFTVAQGEVGKRTQAEKKMTEGIADTVGSNALQELMQSFAEDRINVETLEAELKKRERAEIELKEAVESGVGASTLTGVIEKLSDSKIDFAPAKSEVGKRSSAESKIIEGVGQTVGSTALKGLIQSMGGERINAESPEITFELKKRERGEAELAERVQHSVGATALNEVMEQLSTVKIDFERAKAELIKRSNAEQKLVEGVPNTVGSTGLKQFMLSLQTERINTETPEIILELKKRERAEVDLAEAVGSSVGSNALSEVIEQLSNVKIDFTAAKAEVRKRSSAEGKVTEGIMKTVGSSALKELLKTLEGIRINSEKAEAEMKERERAEADLAEGMGSSLGAKALNEVIDKLSAAKIDFTAARAEVEKRSNAETALTKAIQANSDASVLRSFLSNSKGTRINWESGEIEVKKREKEEAELGKAIVIPGMEALRQAIERLSDSRIDLAAAKAELQKRSDATAKIEEAVRKSDDARPIKEALESCKGIQVDSFSLIRAEKVLEDFENFETKVAEDDNIEAHLAIAWTQLPDLPKGGLTSPENELLGRNSAIYLGDGKVCLFQHAKQFFSTDFGKTWRETAVVRSDNGALFNDGIHHSCPKAVVLGSGKILLVIHYNKTHSSEKTFLRESDDGGKSWTIVNPKVKPVARNVTADLDCELPKPPTAFVVLSDQRTILMMGRQMLEDVSGTINRKTDVLRSDDEGKTWECLTAPMDHRRQPAFVSCEDGSVLILGGIISSGGSGNVTNEVWRTRLQGASWEQLPTPPWDARFNAMATCLSDGKILLMGGCKSSKAECFNDVWVSDDMGTSWRELACAPWSPRCNDAIVQSESGAFLVLGDATRDGHGMGATHVAFRGDPSSVAPEPEAYAIGDRVTFKEPKRKKNRVGKIASLPHGGGRYRILLSDGTGLAWRKQEKMRKVKADMTFAERIAAFMGFVDATRAMFGESQEPTTITVMLGDILHYSKSAQNFGNYKLMPDMKNGRRWWQKEPGMDISWTGESWRITTPQGLWMSDANKGRGPAEPRVPTTSMFKRDKEQLILTPSFEAERSPDSMTIADYEYGKASYKTLIEFVSIMNQFDALVAHMVRLFSEVHFRRKGLTAAFKVMRNCDALESRMSNAVEKLWWVLGNKMKKLSNTTGNRYAESDRPDESEGAKFRERFGNYKFGESTFTNHGTVKNHELLDKLLETFVAIVEHVVKMFPEAVFRAEEIRYAGWHYSPHKKALDFRFQQTVEKFDKAYDEHLNVETLYDVDREEYAARLRKLR